MLAPCDLRWRWGFGAEWAGGLRHPTTGELFADSLEERVGARDVRTLRKRGGVASGFELRGHRLRLGEHVVDRNLARLDGEEALLQIAFDLERRRTFTQPSRGRRDQAHEVVRILRPELAWELEFVRAVAREGDEGFELVRIEEALIVERAIELLHVLLCLMDRVGLRREGTRRDLRQAFGDRVEREIGIGPQPFEDGRAMFGETLALLEALQLAERIAPEASVDLGGDERIPLREDPLADRVLRLRARDEEHLERVGIGTQRLADRLARRPIGRAAVFANEIFGRSGEALRPGERMREDSTAIVVG